MKKADILEPLIERLLQHKTRWPEIADEADVPLTTLRKLALRHTPNPGVLTCERLIRVVGLPR